MMFTKRILFVMLCGLLASAPALADNHGLIKKKSPYTVSVTLDRLESLLKKKGITVALRWNHAARAKSVGMALADSQLLVFGNPKLGTPLMQSNPQMGIDLPMKALAYKDAAGQVWLMYNDPTYLKKRHAITDKDKVFAKMAGALDKLTSLAVQK